MKNGYELTQLVAVGADQYGNRRGSLGLDCMFDVVEVRYAVDGRWEGQKIFARQRTYGHGVGCLDASQLGDGLGAIEQTNEFVPIVAR